MKTGKMAAAYETRTPSRKAEAKSDRQSLKTKWMETAPKTAARSKKAEPDRIANPLKTKRMRAVAKTATLYRNAEAECQITEDMRQQHDPDKAASDRHVLGEEDGKGRTQDSNGPPGKQSRIISPSH